MKALLALDDDDRTADVLGVVDGCLALGSEDEVLVTHVVATLRWMPFRSASDPGWAGTERAIFERVDDFLSDNVRMLESKGLRARPLRREGDVAEEILRAAEEESVDVIALGALGQARSQDFLVGSVAEKVVALGSRDALLVRPAADSATGKARFRALLAVDGSPLSLDAVDAFAAKMRSENAEIRVLHVLEMPTPSWDVALAASEGEGPAVPAPFRARADAAVREALARLEGHGLTAETVLRRGNASREILEEADSWQASVIVLGARGESGDLPLGSMRGTTFKRVSRHARCSVFVVAPREASS